MESAVLAVVVAAALAIVFHRLNQPSVTAYVITGILLGPAVFGVTSHSEPVRIFSELGLAFLLFLIGLEMDVGDVREIIRPTLFIGLLQMAVMAFAGFTLGQLVGFDFTQSVFAGIFLMFSSTAVVVKMLSDKDEITSLPGRLDVSMLLLQDVVVVLGLTVLNTGASTVPGFAAAVGETTLFIVFAAVFSVLSSKYLLKHLFDSYAEEKHGFLIYAVTWLFVFIQVSELLNLSIEIGAFLAGLGLGRLKISEEVMERIRPLTDVFMAVFFLGVGLELDQAAISGFWVEALIFSMAVIPLKFVMGFLLTDHENFSPETSFISSINMTQVSEFSIILASLAASKQIISTDFVGFAALTAVITMSISAYFISYNRELYNLSKPLLDVFESGKNRDVDINRLNDHAVVIGYGKMAEAVLPELEDVFDNILVIDSGSENVDRLSRADYEYIYGDFKHGEIRNSARLGKASLVISFSEDHNLNLQVLEDVDSATVFLRSTTLEEALELYELGAHYVIRDNVLTADQLNDYLELYLEDRKAFREEIKAEEDRIRWFAR
ncbi:MAG: cation:proton antiporter [Candidatus Nanohalobium sp.]